MRVARRVEERHAGDFSAIKVKPVNVGLRHQVGLAGLQCIAQCGDGGNALGADRTAKAAVEAAIVTNRAAIVGPRRDTHRGRERMQAGLGRAARQHQGHVLRNAGRHRIGLAPPGSKGTGELRGSLNPDDVFGERIEGLEVVVVKRPVDDVGAGNIDVGGEPFRQGLEFEIRRTPSPRLPVGVIQPAPDDLRQTVHLTDHVHAKAGIDEAARIEQGIGIVQAVG